MIGLDKPPRAVLYARVSTNKQSVEGASLETQESMARDYCAANGWDLVDVYVDAITGRKDDRPDFRRLLEAAPKRPRPFDVVLMYKVDRMARRARFWYEAFGILEDAGIEVKSLTQPIGSTKEGRMMMHFLVMAAEMESDNIGERVRDTRRFLASQGRWTPARTPLGYRYIPNSVGPGGEKVPGHVEIVEEEAEVARLVFELYLRLRSARGVAVEMNRRGLRTKQGSLFTSGAVTRVVRNPAYAGDRVFGRHGVVWQGKRRRVVAVPSSRWMVRAGEVPAIVTREVWLEAQRIMDTNKQLHPREAWALRRHTWTALLRCGCGCGMTRCFYREKDTLAEREYWVCNRAHTGGRTACSIYARVGAPFLEKDVLAAIASAVDHAGGRDVEPDAPPVPQRPPASERTRRITELEGQRQRLNRLYLKGKINEEDYDREEADISRQIAVLAAVPEPPALRPLPKLDGTFMSIWAELTTDERGAFLRLFVDHIEALDEDGSRIVIIHWRELVGDGWPTEPTTLVYRRRRRWQTRPQ